MCCFSTFRLFLQFVLSYAYGSSNIKVVLNSNIELSLNPERTSQRQGYGPGPSQRRGYGPHTTPTQGYGPVVEFKPRRYNETTNQRNPYSSSAEDTGNYNSYNGRRSRLPDPDQEMLLKIPATSNCRCYNNDPVQGRIRYQPYRDWLQRLVDMAYYRILKEVGVANYGSVEFNTRHKIYPEIQT